MCQSQWRAIFLSFLKFEFIDSFNQYLSNVCYIQDCIIIRDWEDRQINQIVFLSSRSLQIKEGLKYKATLI